MQYFNTLPKVVYTTPDGTSTSYTNLMSRASIIPSILKNPLLYYTYDVKDSDTPEIIAEKYYGDSYRYWIVLMSNQMLDPQWDWPLSYSNFNNYLNDKYTSQGVNPLTTIQAYQKTTILNNVTLNTTTNTVVDVSQTEFQSSGPSSGTLTVNGEVVHYSITYSSQSIYDYEYQLNESKRTINLLNKDYVVEIERELSNLMS